MIRAHSKSEVLEICEEINIPFAPVAETKDLFDDPQLNANGRMLVTQLPDGRTVKLPRLPIEIGDHDLGLRTQPPEDGRAYAGSFEGAWLYSRCARQIRR